MKKKYSVLIIGCGNAGLKYEFDKLRAKPASLYGGALTFKDDFEICAVCDSDEEQLAFVQEKLPGAKAYSDYKEAVSDIKPDVAVIATWTSSHCEIFKYVLENGVKAVVLEKPVGISPEEADEMKAVWQKYPVPVAVNHVRRWEKSYRFLRSLLDGEELGPVRSVYGRVLLGAVKEEYEEEMLRLEGGGSMYHDGTHLIDMLLYMFEKLEFVDGVVKMGKLLDRSTHGMLLGNGEIPVFIEVGGERSFFEFSITVEAQRGSCTIGNGIREWKGIEKSKLYEGFRDAVIQKFPEEKMNKFSGGYGYAGPFYDILQGLNGRTDLCCGSFEDGIRSVKLMNDILEKSRKIKTFEGSENE